MKGINYKEEAFSRKKLLIKRISDRIEGTYADENILGFNTVYSIYNKNDTKEDLLYLLGILNSGLMEFFYEYSYNVGMNLTTQVTISFLSKVPIKISEENKNKLVSLVEDMLNKKEELEKNKEKKTRQTEKIRDDIIILNRKIDDIVYDIYDITKKEQNIIEESLES